MLYADDAGVVSKSADGLARMMTIIVEVNDSISLCTASPPEHAKTKQVKYRWAFLPALKKKNTSSFSPVQRGAIAELVFFWAGLVKIAELVFFESAGKPRSRCGLCGHTAAGIASSADQRIYFKWKGRVWANSFQVLSDDRTQDNAWAQDVMFKLMTEHVPVLMRKLGAPAMVRAIFFTDNCAKRFKCRLHFGWLASHEVIIRDINGESTNVPVHAEHHYFGSCHGKSVQSPRHLCTLLGESVDFILEEPTKEEMTFEASRTSSSGGDQLLVTTVWGSESRCKEGKTFLVTKKPNTLLGRKHIFQAAGDILHAVRSASRSELKAIKVEGCQANSKIVATETPGVVATYTLEVSRRTVGSSCFCCELCRKGETEKCNLFREGIMEAPAEWSRRRSNDDEETTKKREIELMFTRMRNPLPYGSVALMRVRPEQYRGQDIVPIFIGRKAPSDYTSSFAKDGMFSEGDVMVWIHDVFSHVRSVEYDVPNVLPVDENRAIPLTSLAGLGQGIEGYMEEVSRASRTSLTTRYRMRRDVVEGALSKLVVMSKRPQDAFVDCRPAKMRKIDRRRAHVQPSLVEAGAIVEKGFKAPPQGRDTAWRGLRVIQAKVVDVISSL
ncbi:unnamed protein product [Ectocarpus sp. CCAP 1310/34]|nr:unnamed protein product [Ectocarpus sp. CCAP 1310/34]